MSTRHVLGLALLLFGSSAHAVAPTGRGAKPRISPTAPTVPWLNKLGLTSKLYVAPPTIKTHGLAETLSMLKKKPFVNGAVPAYTKSAIKTLIEQSYESYVDTGAKMSGPAAQANVARIMTRLQASAKSELGLQPSQLGPEKGASVVLEGGAAAQMNANMSAAGTMLVHRAAIQQTDQVGHALAFATDKVDLGQRMRAIALGTYKQQYIHGLYDAKAVRPLADAALAYILGHESTHGYRQHGLVYDAATDPNVLLEHSRTKEQVADLGGLQLATRAGFSAKGQLGGVMLLAAYDQISKEQFAAAGQVMPANDHPAGIVRYQRAMGFFTGTALQPRRLYGKGQPATGAPLVDAAQEVELAKLPTAAELPGLLAAAPQVVTPPVSITQAQ